MNKKDAQVTFFAQNRQKVLIGCEPVRILRAVLTLNYLFMTKQNLVDSAAAAAGVSKRVAADVLQALVDAVTKTLKKGDSLTVTGFGTFRVSKRAARMGVNPRKPTERIKIPAMKVPTFKAGKTLKDAVR